MKHHKFVDGIECDILVQGSPMIAVEVDGRYWHAERVEVDVAKNKRLAAQGVTVVRVRDHILGPISEHDVLIDEASLQPRDIAKLVENICKIKLVEPPGALDQYATGSSFLAEQEFKELSERLPLPPAGTSFMELHPDLALAWDYERNALLTPEQVTPGSPEAVWWRCGNGHSFERRVGIYVRTNRCPHCEGSARHDFVPLEENSFGGRRPDLVLAPDQKRGVPI